jgi:sulfoxide reductase heme-binding subunit YedZ
MPTTATISAMCGVIAMVLLTAVVAAGIVVNRRARLPGLPRFAGLSGHRYLALLALTFLALHVLTAVLGRYARIAAAAVLIPFLPGADQLWIGLGAVATDLLIALVATSLLRARVGRRAWRALHWLAYACWPVAIAHSIGTGSGMRAGRLLDVAVACILTVLAAASWRLFATMRGGAATRSAVVIRPRRMARPPAQGEPQPGRLILHVDPIACTGHGLCAELLPEVVALDQWGYPLLASRRVPAYLDGRARRAVTDCPALALRLAPAADEHGRRGLISGHSGA